MTDDFLTRHGRVLGHVLDHTLHNLLHGFPSAKAEPRLLALGRSPAGRAAPVAATRCALRRPATGAALMGPSVMAAVLAAVLPAVPARAQPESPSSPSSAPAAAAAPTAPGAPPPVAPSAAAPQVIVVTGTVGERALDAAPFAASVLTRDALDVAGPGVHLSEAMARVPGMVVANRSNYAQDLQISSRGFGARAGFGVRGIRLYADGIPATGPDGQGQVSHFDLDGAERVEVLRGPYSVLYGNASGGVINVIPAALRENSAMFGLDADGNGMRQQRLVLTRTWAAAGDERNATRMAAAAAAPLALRVSAATLRSDGFRPHSRAQRDLLHLRLAGEAGADRWGLTASHLDQPSQDPLGLARAQFETDPLSTASQATQFNTRKTTRQTQLGSSWRHRFDSTAGANAAVGDLALQDIQLAAYTGQRRVVQWLAIPPATQANPNHGGGVIDLARRFSGAELRLRAGSARVSWLAGLALDEQRDDRQGFENFIGTQLGVTGALRRDERNRARSVDAFLQAEWSLAETVEASAGMRGGRLTMAADDFYLDNGDDSGRRRFEHWQPVLGLSWAATPGLRLHAAAARGFEAPTLAELAYRPDGSGGFNTALQPQRSRQIEAGAKWRLGAAAVDFALFEARVDDEIGVATNAGGRASFQNVGRTLRRGAELSAQAALGGNFSAGLSATLLRARYGDDFLACAAVPCLAPSVVVPAGNRIAGTQRASGWAELAWRDPRWGQLAVELRGAGDTVVNDRNTDAAAGYGVWALRWSQAVAVGAGWQAEWLARLDNATDRRYAGSLIVGEGNGRFFETAPPRSVSLSLKLRWAP